VAAGPSVTVVSNCITALKRFTTGPCLNVSPGAWNGTIWYFVLRRKAGETSQASQRLKKQIQDDRNCKTSDIQRIRIQEAVVRERNWKLVVRKI